MGSVLLQPQRVRRGQHAHESSRLMTELATLITRLAVDRKTGGRIGEMVQETLVTGFERIVTERTAQVDSAAPRIVKKLLGLVQAVVGVRTSVKLTSPSDAIDLVRQILNHLADGVDGVTTVEIRPHVAVLIDILENDLGLGLVQVETEFWRLIDEIIARLENAPPEPTVQAQENRIQTACVLRRMRKLVKGNYTVPRLDADRIAGLIASLLVKARAPRFAVQLRCAAQALEVGANTGRSITELITLPAFSQFRSLGAAAAAAEDEKYCWYASWLVGKDVIINKERTEIKADSTVIATGENLDLKDIPYFKPDGTPRYTFTKTLDIETMEWVAFWSLVFGDGLIVLLHAVSIEEGDYASNLVHLAFPLVYDIGKIHTRRPLMPLWAEDWLLPIIVDFPVSLQGIHTNAAGEQTFLMWLTLFGPDFGEERLYRGFARYGRALVLEILTLINHKKSASGNHPANFNELNSVCACTGYLFGLLISFSVPREDYAITKSAGGRSVNGGFLGGWFIGLASISWLAGRILGGLIAWPIAGEAAPKAWFRHGASAGNVSGAIGMGFLNLLANYFWYFGFLYWYMDGNTDDGHYNPGGANFNGYPDHKSSPYTLPYPSGDSGYVFQANQGLWSHNALNVAQVYACDFSLDQDHTILASRPGTVVDWFDAGADNSGANATTTAIAAPPITFVNSSVLQQAASANTIAGPAIAVTAGDLIVLFAAAADAAATLTPSDDQGNAYTARPVIAASGFRAQAWFARANATGNVTITVTFDVAATNRIWQVAVYQNAGALFTGAQQSQAAVSGPDSVTAGTLNNVGSGDLVIGWAVAPGGGATLAAGTNFTARSTAAVVAGTRIEDRLNASGAVAVTFSPNAATDSIAYALAFRALRSPPTLSNTGNFVLIRHDVDADGNPLAAGVFDPVHDRDAGGTPTRTYAIYLHGRNGSVQAAFATRGIAPNAIVGTVVRRGDFIMRVGDTGISFNNHLHMHVCPGPDVGTGPPVANSNVGNSIPFVYRDVENSVRGTDGVPFKLNFYTSTTERT